MCIRDRNIFVIASLSTNTYNSGKDKSRFSNRSVSYTHLPEEGEDKAPQLYEHFRFVADRGQSLLRVDKFLVDRMFGATRNRIQSAADAGCIMANGKPVKSNYRVKPEDVVTIMMTRPPRTFEILPENIPIKICLLYTSRCV